MTEPGPKIAVAPTEHPWAAGMVGAVERGGGTPATPADAQALIWLGKDGDDLRDVLHPGISWVQLRAAGVEYWIDSGEIDRDRRFTSARGAYARSVAEHVVALILGASRNLHSSARSREWDPGRAEGRLLRGATVGIIGAGAIGELAISYLKPMGVRIVAVTRSGREVAAADESLPASELSSVWPRLDYAVLLAPATAETESMVGAAELAALPDHAWIINLARGTLIDTAALVAALRGNVIRGAALDVTDPEPLPADHELWTLPNVLITPHVANPKAFQHRLLEDHVQENVARFVQGRDLLAVVDLAAGY